MSKKHKKKRGGSNGEPKPSQPRIKLIVPKTDRRDEGDDIQAKRPALPEQAENRTDSSYESTVDNSAHAIRKAKEFKDAALGYIGYPFLKLLYFAVDVAYRAEELESTDGTAGNHKGDKPKPQRGHS